MSRRCSCAVSSEAGRSGSWRPTRSSAPSAFCSASRSSTRAFGVLNTVRNGPSCSSRRPAPTSVFWSAVEFGENGRRLLRADDSLEHARARRAGELGPIDPHGALLRDELADERFERGRLAAPVRTDQRVHASGGEIEIDVVERDEAAEALRQAAGAQRFGATRLEVARAREASVSERAAAAFERAPPVTRGREQASAAEAEDEQHPVAGEHLLEPPGREAAETADLLRCIRERADQEQADDWAERQPRSAEDDRHEELERDGWPVRRRVRDLEQLDSEGARNAGDHGGSGEDPKACACEPVHRAPPRHAVDRGPRQRRARAPGARSPRARERRARGA